MKTERIRIRVTEDQKTKIKSLSEENHMSLSAYILYKSLGKNSPQIIREINREINNVRARNFKVENNINQIAKRMNSNKNLSKTDFEDFKNLYKTYQKEISEQNRIIKKLKKIFLK